LKGFAADEAALAVEELASKTNDLDQSLKLLQPALTIARIGQLGAAQAAQHLNSTMKLLGLPLNQAGRVADYVAFAVQNMGARATEAAPAIEHLAKVASGTNMAFEDLAVATALISRGSGDLAQAQGIIANIAHQIAAADKEIRGIVPFD